MRTSALGALLIAIISACGSSPSMMMVQLRQGTPVAGEGNLCPTGSTTSCSATQGCELYSGYQSSTGVCRTLCDAGCSAGESCGSDQTCQCTASLPDGGDSCFPSNLVCHPTFDVCVPQVASGTSCPTGEKYSPLYGLCVPD